MLEIQNLEQVRLVNLNEKVMGDLDTCTLGMFPTPDTGGAGSGIRPTFFFFLGLATLQLGLEKGFHGILPENRTGILLRRNTRSGFEPRELLVSHLLQIKR